MKNCSGRPTWRELVDYLSIRWRGATVKGTPEADEYAVNALDWHVVDQTHLVV